MSPINLPVNPNPDTRYKGELPQFVPSEAARNATERANAAQAAKDAAPKFSPAELETLDTNLTEWVDDAPKDVARIREMNTREMNAVHLENRWHNDRGRAEPWTKDQMDELEQLHSNRLASAEAEVELRPSVMDAINLAAQSAVAREPHVEVFIPFVEKLPYLGLTALIVTPEAKPLPASTGWLDPSMAATGHSTSSTDAAVERPTSVVKERVDAALEELMKLPLSPQPRDIFNAARHALKEIQSMGSGQAHACERLEKELVNLEHRTVNADSLQFLRNARFDVKEARAKYLNYS